MWSWQTALLPSYWSYSTGCGHIPVGLLRKASSFKRIWKETWICLKSCMDVTGTDAAGEGERMGMQVELSSEDPPRRLSLRTACTRTRAHCALPAREL